MHPPKFPRLHPHAAPANTGDAADAASTVEPGAFIATLHHIGNGAAADGHPWPEPHHRPGRRMALGDADCALAGLRVAQEMVLAAERIRQNGPEHEFVGDRVMEGLMMACVALTAQVSARLRPDE